jgi:hypothetical protein
VAIEDIVQIATGVLFITGWISFAAFGIFLYLDIRSLSKDTIAARLFLHFSRFVRAFLILSIGFAVVLFAFVASIFQSPATPYVGLASISVWFVCIVWSFYWFFKALHVPKAIRRKYGGAPAER